MVVKLEGAELETKYNFGDNINGKIIIGKHRYAYKWMCERCGNEDFTAKKNIEVRLPFCKKCRLEPRTMNIKNRIVAIMEMFYGNGIMIPKIAELVGVNQVAVSHIIRNHGDKKKGDYSITLKSKVC